MNQKTRKFNHRFQKVVLTSIFALSSSAAMLTSTDTAFAETAKTATTLSTNSAANQAASARTSDETISDWKAWVRDHAYGIKSIEPEKTVNGDIASDRFADLNMLKPLLHDKRFVFLGESSHGAAEYNLAKTRLIQFLHQEMGYNVLAFESGLSNSTIANGRLKEQSAEQTMKDSLLYVWWTQETLPLFDYVKETQKTKQPLKLAGFDIQSDLPFINGDWLKDKELAKRLAETEEALFKWQMSKDIEGYRKAKPSIVKVYEQVKEQLKTHEQELTKAYPNEPQIVKLLDRALSDRIRVAEEYLEITIQAFEGAEKGDMTMFMKLSEWRDQAMVDNLIWLATEVYPTEKFIVWGHNGHLRKANSEVMGNPFPGKAMGEMWPDEYKRYSYVIGLYATEGETADNTRVPIKVLTPKPGSVEDILSAANHPYTFMDLHYRQNERGNSWMFEPRFAYDWGFRLESLVPSAQYDGILLIDKVRVPQYINLEKSQSK